MAVTCPACGAPAAPDERFCESCGAPLAGGPTGHEAVGAPSSGVPAPPLEAGGPHEGTLLDDASQDATDMAKYSPIRTVDADLGALPAVCANCAGTVAEDGYCEQCGAAVPRRRDHWLEQPADWLAGVCERGVRHIRNEDAMAVAAAAEPSSLGAMVVCDGVSMAPGSDVASLAAARAARDAMVSGLRLRPRSAAPGSGIAVAPAGGRPGSTAQQTARAGELTSRLLTGGAAAQEHAAAAGAEALDDTSPPSCTFVAALVEGGDAHRPGLLVAGWVGDSRAYWLPDGGIAVQISQDDSWAFEAMAHGMPRAEAERMPQAHAITRWLGADAPDPVPHTAVLALDRPGWVLLCSDGLWNYCSDPADMSALVERVAAAQDPSGAEAQVGAVAEALAAWAVDQGGHDNITVALARFDPLAQPTPPADDGSARAQAVPADRDQAGGEDRERAGDGPDDGDGTPREEPEQAGV